MQTSETSQQSHNREPESKPIGTERRRLLELRAFSCSFFVFPQKTVKQFQANKHASWACLTIYFQMKEMKFSKAYPIVPLAWAQWHRCKDAVMTKCQHTGAVLRAKPGPQWQECTVAQLHLPAPWHNLLGTAITDLFCTLG